MKALAVSTCEQVTTGLAVGSASSRTGVRFAPTTETRVTRDNIENILDDSVRDIQRRMSVSFLNNKSEALQRVDGQ